MLVRVDPGESDALISSGKASLMEMGGRTMRGWLRVEPGGDLESWVERGTAYARSLPAK
jgi:hypothetical protein